MDAEKIEVKNEDIEEEYANIAKNYSMDVEKVKSLASVETIAYDVRLRKAYDFIFDNLA
jgi:trigger factor